MGSDKTVGPESPRRAGPAPPRNRRSVDDGHGPSSTVGTGALTLGALGIVYGDIGTSPLYALKEAFTEESHVMTVDTINVYGVCSLAFWSLILIVSVKYLALVMRADNKGEGGTLALTSLLLPSRGDDDASEENRGGRTGAKLGLLIGLGVFGTALLYGDGAITPAISVLSAVEGLEKVSTSFTAWVLPIAVAILCLLFFVQKRGTGAVGRVFGPIMLVWFGTISLMGITHVIDAPGIIASINPMYAVDYFAHESGKAFLSLGSIILVVTGGEALYADMGHFGRKPITYGWYGMVLPSLLLNYWGQGAFLLASENPDEVVESVFFSMVPQSMLLPLVILATCATIIASQALISGVFSLTAQAVQFDYLPRIKILHTSREHYGQIYVPLVNWLLWAACIGLVLGFRSSSNLAAAYGIAVTMTMTITTLIFYRVLVDKWGWKPALALAVSIPLLLIELGFLGANLVKIPHGGWFAVAVGVILMVQMQTWRRGRALVAARIHRGERDLGAFLDETEEMTRVHGTAVFLFKDLGKAPPALVNNLRHNKVLHSTTLIVSVLTDTVPRIESSERVAVERVAPGVFQVELNFGFMDEPDVPAALSLIDHRGVEFDPDDATYFIGRESIVAGKVPGMHPLQEQLFVLLNRGADSAVRFFNLPVDRVFEAGTRVEI